MTDPRRPPLEHPRGRGWRRARRTASTLASLVTGVVVASGLAVPAYAEPVVLDFEDVPANGRGQPATAPVTDFYRELGVRLNGPTVLDYDAGRALPGFVRSGSQAVTPCYSEEFCTDPVTLDFAVPQVRVAVWVGFDVVFGAGGPGGVVLVAYDGNGEVVSQAFAPLQPGTSAQPVDIRLEAVDEDAAIRRVEVRWRDPAQQTNGLVVDDVELEPAAAQLRVLPDTVDLGEVVVGGDPRAVEATVSNVGNVPVAVTAVRLVGSEDVRADAGDCAGRTLRPGESCAVGLELLSRTPGPLTATLVVSGVGVPAQEILVRATAVTAEATGPVGSPSPGVPGIAWVGLALLVLTGGLVALLARRPRRPVRKEDPPADPPEAPRVSVVTGPAETEVAGPAPVVTVSLAFDPSTGSSEWREGSQR